jgi:hypothetical protein
VATGDGASYWSREKTFLRKSAIFQPLMRGTAKQHGFLHIGANLNAGNLCMYAGLHNLSLVFHNRALEAYTQRGNNPWWKIGLLNNMGQTYLQMFQPDKTIELYRQVHCCSRL